MSFDQLTVNRDSSYVTWQQGEGLTEAQKARVASGEIGEVQDVQVLQDGSYQVKTDLGTLTLRGPELDAVKEELSVGDFITTADHVSSIDAQAVLDMTAVLILMAQCNIERRSVDRGVRQANRDIAVTQALDAADRIRSGALTNLIMGCVSGAINIIMGAASAISAGKSLIKLGTTGQQNTMAQSQLKVNQAEVKMQQSRLDVAKQQQVVDAKQAKLDKLGDIDNQIATKQSQLDRAKLFETGKPGERTQITKLENELNQLKAQKAEIPQLKSELQAETTKLNQMKSTLSSATKSYEAELTRHTNYMGKLAKNAEGRVDSKWTKLTNQTDTVKADAAQKRMMHTDALQDGARLKQLQQEPPITSQNAKQVEAQATQDLQAAHQRLEVAGGKAAIAGKAFEAEIELARTRSTFWQGMSQGTGGAADILKSIGQYEEQRATADSKEMEAHAEKAKAAADDITADMQAALDFLKDVKDSLQAIRQSQKEVHQAIMQA